MAESRIKVLTISAWLALLASSGAFVTVGLMNANGDALPWLLDVALWSIVIAGVAMIAVPAPSGSRISLGIGAAVAASVLLHDPVALGASVSIALVATWLIQTRLDIGERRTDGDYLADTLAMVVYAVVYSNMYELIVVYMDLQPTWTVLGAVAVAGLAWFILRAIVAAFVGADRFRRRGGNCACRCRRAGRSRCGAGAGVHALPARTRRPNHRRDRQGAQVPCPSPVP